MSTVFLDELREVYIQDTGKAAVAELLSTMLKHPGKMVAWRYSTVGPKEEPLNVEMPLLDDWYDLVHQHYPFDDTADVMTEVIDSVLGRSLRVHNIQATCMGDGDSVWFKLVEG